MVPKSSALNKVAKNAFKKKWLRVTGIVILSVLALESLLYFGSNLFLSGIAREKIASTSHGVYSLDFNRIHFSLLRRGIFLDGIVFQPIHPEKASSGQVLFEFTLEELSFTGLWFDFFDQELTIGRMVLDNPNLQALGARSDRRPTSSTSFLSPVALLESEIQKSLERLPLAGIKINSLQVAHADVLFLNFLSQQELSAKNASLQLVDVDWTTKQGWKTPFNARGFEVELEQASFLLPDGVHRLSSNKVNISSIRNTIDLEQFALVPDLSKSSSAYYSLNLAELHIGNVDLNTAVVTSNLNIEELILEAPQIQLIQSTTTPANSSSVDLHAFIRGKLNALSIKELSIRGASFLRKEKEDTLRNRIQLDQLDLNLVDFYLGGDSLRKEDQFIYGKDASMEVGKVQVLLGDKVHVLQGEKLLLSSFKKEVSMHHFRLSPRPEIASGDKPSALYSMGLEELVLEVVDLKKWYQKGELEVERALLSQPKIEISEKVSLVGKPQVSPLAAFFAGLGAKVFLHNLELKEGTVLFEEESGKRSKDLELGRFNLLVKELKLHPSTTSFSLKDQVELEQLQLVLYDYRLRLRDNLHEFFAGELRLDSKQKLLEIKNLRIKPENPNQVRQQLQALGKTSALDFNIPLLRAEGIALGQVLLEDRLQIHELQLSAPTFHWSTYRPKESKGSVNTLRSAEDLKDLLLGYFDEIQVDSVRIDDAEIQYENKVKEAGSSFQEDSLTFRLKNFALSNSKSSREDQTLFSDEVNVTFTSYSFSLPGGKYLVDTDFLNYNSRTRRLELENLRLLPTSLGEQRAFVGLTFPKVSFQGVNMEEFVFDNILQLQRLEIDGGEIGLFIDRKVTSTNSKGLKNSKIALQKAIEYLYVDSITAKNATLELSYLDQDQEKRAVKTGFGFGISQLQLDSLRLVTQDFSNMYEGINLGLTDFEFDLPDSIHTLKFDGVGFGDQLDDVVFSGVYIQAKNMAGKKGRPVVVGKIDQLILKKNSILNMLSTKTLELKEVRLRRPRLSIYLDSLVSEATTGTQALEAKGVFSLIQSITLADLLLENGQVDFYSKSGKPYPNLQFPQVDFKIYQLGLDLMKRKGFPKWGELVSKKWILNLEGYETYSKDSSYKISLDKLGLADNHLYLEGLHYRPILGVYELLKAQPFQTEVVLARIKRIDLEGIDFQKIVTEDLFQAERLKVDGLSLELFKDKRKPMDSSAYKPMPQYFMEHARIRADLALLQLRNSDLKYWEFGEKSRLPGSIAFQDLQLDMAPFFLRKEGTGVPVSSLRFGINALMGDSSSLGVAGQLYLEPDYPMDLKFTLDNFPLAYASDLLSKTAFVRPVNGKVTHGTWEFRVNEQHSFGHMVLGYQDLKLQFLDTLTLEPGKGKLKLYTNLANIWVRKSNPRAYSNKTVVREMYRLRDTRKSLINAWWKVTFEGLKSTIGLRKSKMPKYMRKKKKK